MLFALIAVMVANNPNAIPGLGVKLNIPKPKVVTTRADNGKSGLFNARTTVYATILNQGGAGNVFVTFKVTQGKKTFDHSKSVYLAADESVDLNDV